MTEVSRRLAGGRLHSVPGRSAGSDEHMVSPPEFSEITVFARMLMRATSILGDSRICSRKGRFAVLAVAAMGDDVRALVRGATVHAETRRRWPNACKSSRAVHRCAGDWAEPQIERRCAGATAEVVVVVGAGRWVDVLPLLRLEVWHRASHRTPIYPEDTEKRSFVGSCRCHWRILSCEAPARLSI